MINDDVYKEVASLINIPEGYVLNKVKEVLHNDDKIFWLRFTKANENFSYGSEHFSITYDFYNKRLKGYMFLDKSLDIDEGLPSEEDAKKITFEFLNKYAKDMVDDLEVRWIKPTKKIPENPPHDQGFSLKSGNIITGMRVKLWNKKAEQFAWVIVGKNDTIVSFERDINWNFETKHRLTQRWLHDAWLLENKVGIL